MNGLKRLIVEIHHRSLWQVLLIYVGGAWICYEIIDTITDRLALPEWLPVLAIILFLIGLPVVLATAFVHEVAPPTVTRAEPTPLTEAEAARIEVERAAAHLEARRRHRFLTGRNAVASFVVALAAWGVVATGWLVLGERGAAPSSEQKSVAVLPFANLSGDPHNEYFSDGITGDIINHLARIADLKVISRTSVMQYRDTERSVREIGEELGVATVLEGEVQRIGDRVRINAQLIDANSDVHLWADQYDRRLEDVFEIQREIAQRIASALQATLTPAERGEIEPTPTDNLDAYDYYLRAIDYRERGEREEDTRSAVEMLQRAVELDPEFAQAWAYLGELHSRVYWMYWDRSEERLNLAKEAAFRAFELQPGLGEAHRALGFYYYWGFLDYDRALEQFSLARNTLPNDAYVWAGIGWVLRRQGKWQGALNNLIKAVELSPRAANTVVNLADTYSLMRRYAESRPHYEEAMLLNPQDPDVYARLAWMYLAWHGGTERAQAVLRKLSQDVDSAEVLSVGIRPRSDVPLIDFLDGDYVRALERVSAAASDVFETQFYFTPKTLLCAQIYAVMREPERAVAYYDSARVSLEAELRERPDDHRIHGALGIAYGGLGRKEEAIREGEDGVELMPVSKEAWKGVHRVQDLAQIYMMVGEYDAAIDQLDYLLSIPGEISVPLLRLDPTWEPLRDHPRFQTLLEKYE